MMPSIRLSAVFVGLFCIVLGATAVHAADAFSVKVEGLQGDLKSNVEAQLASMGIGSITIEGRYRARVRSGVRTGLRALGYYDPQLKFSWGPKPAEGSRNPRELTVVVTPGDPVKVMGAELSLEGDAANDPDFAVLRKNLPKKAACSITVNMRTSRNPCRALLPAKAIFKAALRKTNSAYRENGGKRTGGSPMIRVLDGISVLFHFPADKLTLTCLNRSSLLRMVNPTPHRSSRS